MNKCPPSRLDPLWSGLYNGCYLLLLLMTAPLWLGQLLVGKKYRRSWKERLIPSSLKELGDRGNRKLFWFHAVSVGETRAIASVAKRLSCLYPDSLMIISNVTETGHAEAKRLLPFMERHLYLPLDLSWIVRPLVEEARPDLVLIGENDLWWQFLRSAAGVKAKIAVINGKLSERSFCRFRRVPGLFRKLAASVDLFCLQSETHAERLASLAIERERLFVCGNTKEDVGKNLLCKEEEARLESFLKQSPLPLLLIGSTHPGEETLLVESLKATDSLCRLCIAPRHPERFDAVAEQLSRLGYEVHRFSAASLPPREGRTLLLLDVMGQLSTAYRHAALAVVGGSFIEGVGGHNILEPPLAGTPVFFGPHMEGQLEMAGAIHQVGAGEQQANSAELAESVRLFFSQTDRSASLKEGVERLQREQEEGKATERTISALVPLIEESKAFYHHLQPLFSSLETKKNRGDSSRRAIDQLAKRKEFDEP